ncbi:hypothetical protein RND71_035560 [Anisodus tanguticus]|uniref:Nitrite/sulphite reductase 4Fe-4S domain-containing protein n=1 Tax=Anisodus tanguticus TaxID=243964 RepID=A0AAE1V1P1_9SOLA|nr:hypothetical protein RND71_035560 [Anisodus tanguticus]
MVGIAESGLGSRIWDMVHDTRLMTYDDTSATELVSDEIRWVLSSSHNNLNHHRGQKVSERNVGVSVGASHLRKGDPHLQPYRCEQWSKGVKMTAGRVEKIESPQAIIGIPRYAKSSAAPNVATDATTSQAKFQPTSEETQTPTSSSSTKYDSSVMLFVFFFFAFQQIMSFVFNSTANYLQMKKREKIFQIYDMPRKWNVCVIESHDLYEHPHINDLAYMLGTKDVRFGFNLLVGGFFSPKRCA